MKGLVAESLCTVSQPALGHTGVSCWILARKDRVKIIPGREREDKCTTKGQMLLGSFIIFTTHAYTHFERRYYSYFTNKDTERCSDTVACLTLTSD